MKHQQPFRFLGRSGQLYATIRLHDLVAGTAREVDREEECGTDEERAAYEQSNSDGRVVLIGNTLAEPLPLVRDIITKPVHA